MNIYALMLFEIREADAKSVEGLFYRTNLSEYEMHIRIWALFKYQEFNTAPSRKRDTTKSNEKENDSMDIDSIILTSIILTSLLIQFLNPSKLVLEVQSFDCLVKMTPNMISSF